MENTTQTTQKAVATCKHEGWKEAPYQQDSETVKMTEVQYALTMTGAWAGRTEGRYLMAYLADGTCHYTGLERFEGTLDGRSGTFILQHTGIYKDNEAHTTYEVVPGSATGELAGLTGKGGYKTGHTDTWEADLQYSL